MYSKGGPRLLITDRESAIYLERAHIHVEGERVVYHITDDEYRREYNIPHINLAVLFIGKGTSITQSAMRLLGEEGVHLAVTGTGGTPLHMGGLTTYRSTRHFREILPIYLSQERSLLAAISIMRDRTERMKNIGSKLSNKWLKVRDNIRINSACSNLEKKLDCCDDIKQLLGFEGNFSKECYATFAEYSNPTNSKQFKREAGVGKINPQNSDPNKLANRLIDHGNYLCYGIAGAALWALGIPPHMSVFHGKTRAGGLVFDLADSFKDALVLPAAFSLAREEDLDKAQKTFRERIITAFDDFKILKMAIDSINHMIDSSSK